MKDTFDILPGLTRIKARFMLLLADRQYEISRHALAAWDARDGRERNDELAAAQHILHLIAGSAGSLGFGDLGQAARACEQSILDYIGAQDAASAEALYEILSELDAVVSMVQSLIDKHA